MPVTKGSFSAETDRAPHRRNGRLDVPATAGGIALEVEGLVKRYGSVTAVDGVSLAVHHGEVFGFLGPNGSGKTTTIGMILGLLRPDAGSVRIFDEPLAGNERRLLPRVGALVETPTFYPYLGARDNLRAVALVHPDLPAGRVDSILQTVGLAAVAHRPYRTYSLGMKQRLGIGAALLADPELVILDEPTNGLDPAGIVEIRALLRQLADQGRAVMLSSHQLNEVQQICDRVSIVFNGRMVAEGSVETLLSDQRMILVTVDHLERASRIVRELSWVTDVSIQSGALAIFGEPPTPFAVSRALGREGIWIGRLTREQGSLERLFLKLTGDRGSLAGSRKVNDDEAPRR